MLVARESDCVAFWNNGQGKEVNVQGDGWSVQWREVTDGEQFMHQRA